MIHRLAIGLGSYICTFENIDSDTTEVVIYALEIIFTKIILFLNLLILGLIINLLIPNTNAPLLVFIYIFTLLLIRKYFGGYHARKSHICMALSTVLPIICFFIGYLVDFNLLTLIPIYIVSYIIGVTVGTVDNENKRLSKDEKKHFQYKGLFLLKFIFILNIILYLLGHKEISDILILAVISGFINLFLGN